MPSLAQKVLDVEIDTQVIAGARWDEIYKLVESHRLIQQARDDFLKFEISVDEYLELVELHGLNVDAYVKSAGQNAERVGIIV